MGNGYRRLEDGQVALIDCDIQDGRNTSRSLDLVLSFLKRETFDVVGVVPSEFDTVFRNGAGVGVYVVPEGKSCDKRVRELKEVGYRGDVLVLDNLGDSFGVNEVISLDYYRLGNLASYLDQHNIKRRNSNLKMAQIF